MFRPFYFNIFFQNYLSMQYFMCNKYWDPTTHRGLSKLFKLTYATIKHSFAN